MHSSSKNTTDLKVSESHIDFHKSITSISTIFSGTDILNKEIYFSTIFSFLDNNVRASLFILDEKIIDCNDKCLSFFNLSRSNVIGKPFNFFLPDTQPNGNETSSYLKDILKQTLTGNCTAFFLQLKINEILFSVTCFYNIHKLGKNKCFYLVFSKVSDFSYFTLSNNNIQNLSHNGFINFIPDGVLIHKQGIVVNANKDALKILELKSLSEIVGKDLFTLVLPEYIEAAKIRMKTLNKGLKVPFFKYKIKSSSGKIKDIEVKSFPLSNDFNSEFFMIIREVSTNFNISDFEERANSSYDINLLLQKEIVDRVNFQSELQRTKHYLTSIINSSLDIIIASDVDGYISEFNSAAQKSFGFDFNEVLGKPLSILYCDIVFFNSVLLSLKSNLSFSGEIVAKRKDGTSFTCFLSLSQMINDDGIAIGLVGFSRDISLHKKQQDKLLQSEAKYREIFENTSDLLFSFSPNGFLVFSNEAFYKNLEYSLPIFEDLNFFEIIHPDYLQIFIDFIHYDHEKVSIENLEVTLLKKTKNYLLIKGSITKKFVDNKLHALICTFKNISDIVLTRELSRLVEDRYKAVFNQDFLAIVITGLFGEIIQYNSRFVSLFSLDSNDLLGKNISEVLPSGPDIFALSNHLLINDILKSTCERVFYNDFNYLVCNESLELVKDSTGNPNFFLYLYEDITDKKNAFNKLASQSAKLNAFLQSSSQIIFTADKDFLLSSFNQQFVILFHSVLGYQPSNQFDFNFLISLYDGYDLDEYFHLHSLALSGKSQYVLKKFVSVSGNIYWFETYIDPIVLDDGSVDEVSYISHNVTEKMLFQEKVSQSLVEKEILLKEVHHRVKNNLQVISSILNLQTSFLKDKKVISTINDVQNRIKSMALIHENLYQNSDLSQLLFSDYIKHLTTNLVHSLQIYDSVKINLHIDEIFLNLDYSIPCGLIINELVSNCFKHAFTDTRGGEVTVSLYSNNDIIELIIGDNGGGFNNIIDFRNTKSLGLQLVTALVEQIGGDINLVTNKKGSVYTIKFKYIK